MFSLHDFLMIGIRDMVEKEPDYKVIQYSAGWADKGVLETADLAEISALIEAKNAPPTEVEEAPTEDLV